MAIPVGMLEWNPSAGTKKLFAISSNGSPDSDTNANYDHTRWHNLVTTSFSSNTYQACAFWNADEDLVIGVRVNGGSWTLYVYDGVAETPQITRSELDNHNSVGLGFDPNGFLHIAYDHHNTALNYRKSNAAISSFDGTLTAELSMVGTNETSIAYPTFFNDPLGNLYFMFRSGAGSGEADGYIYKYTHGTTTWASLTGLTAGKLIDGLNSAGVHNPYWSGPPLFSSDWDGAGTGFMYVSWVWRASTAVTDDHDLSIVKWDGTDWLQMDGDAQTIPILTTNAEIIDAAAVNSGLAAFNTMVLDSDDFPHVIYGKNDSTKNNYGRAWHIYWNGSAWSTTAAFSPVTGSANHNFSNSTLDAVIDADDTIRVICVAPTTTTVGVWAFVSEDATWTEWRIENLTLGDVSVAEGAAATSVSFTHDPYQWEVNGVVQGLVPLAGDSGGTNDSFPEGWTHISEATVTNPSAALTDPFVIIDGANLPTSFWATVATSGEIRAADEDGNMLPIYVHSFDGGTDDATIFVKWFGTLATSGTQKIRLYAGHPSATTLAVGDYFGQHNVWRQGLMACYPNGGGNDVTRYANNLTGAGSVSFGGVAGPFGTLLATDYNGSSQYGQKTSVVQLSAAPTSEAILAWVNSDSSAANQVVAHHADTAAVQDYYYGSVNGATGDVFNAATRDAAPAASVAASAGTYSPTTWYHLGARFPTTSSRFAFIDGTAGTENTTAHAPAGLDSLSVGAFITTSVSSHFDGKLSMVQVYSSECPAAAEFTWQSAQSNQATFWGTWAEVDEGGGNPAGAAPGLAGDLGVCLFSGFLGG
jgi:hypothetical protein